MYAHQVIEDLYKYSNADHGPLGTIFTENFKEKISSFIPLIIKSHKFHLGDMNELYSLFKNRLAGKPVFSEFKEYQRLPYNLCWFDYFCKDNFHEQFSNPKAIFDVSKRGLLVREKTKTEFDVVIFNYYDINKTWSISAVIYKIDILQDKPISPCFIDEAFSSANLQDFLESDRGDLATLSEAMLLLNCKNIIQENIIPSQNLNLKRIRNGKQPTFSYKILKLYYPKHKDDIKQDYDTSLYHNRVHFCRGHFKEYKEDKPLFGRIVGLWWWQSHMRGQGDGLIAKKYQLSIHKDG